MPPVKTANPFSFLFLFFLILFIISAVIILSPILLILLVVLFFYAIFARERWIQTNRKFRNSDFIRRHFHTRTNRKKTEESDPEVVDVGFTVLKEDDPDNSGRSSC